MYSEWLKLSLDVCGCVLRGDYYTQVPLYNQATSATNVLRGDHYPVVYLDINLALRFFFINGAFILSYAQTQFLLVIIVSVYNLYSGCGYDRRVQWTAVIYLTTQFLLFMDFYIKSYTRPSPKGTSVVEREGDSAHKFSTGGDSRRKGVRLRQTAKKTSAS